ncbi:MAG: lytic transglycosylase domain-containing protein [Candidatus Korobacteraceae bacterium]|jgi:hypothetical protein
MSHPGSRNTHLLGTPARRWHLLVVLGLCALGAQAAELARLSNGFNLRCERHEQAGENTRLYLGGSGFVDVPTANIAGFELAFDAPATPADIQEHIARAGAQTGIDPDFIHSVVRAESGYNSQAVSPKGAQGLMQLMPATASRLGVSNSLDPAANLDGGSRYLRELLARYDGDAQKALAAYNAGPERVEKYKGVPPYPETRNYVTRVINDFNRRKLAAAASSSKLQGKPAPRVAKPVKRRKPAPASPKAVSVRESAITPTGAKAASSKPSP